MIRIQKKRHQHENPGIAGRAMRMVIILLLPVQSFVNAQVDTPYAFIVAGHAYGSHDGVNIGLHPDLLNSLNSGYDSNVAFIVFTGDIVNYSTSESWQQVEDELAVYGLPYYYVMGNHDDNDTGWQVFEDKFGGTWYSFYSQNELYIVLNSCEEERSISSNQVDFLNEQINIAGDTIRNIFIFFHELLWNSHEKYIGVMSNSRSRYDQIVNYSNYWEEIQPLLSGKPDKNFYIIAGDVGGNPDAVAAFYDTWDNVTLLASGMGEVADENYLLIQVHNKDSVEIGLVPLNSDISLPEIEFYSAPPAPEAIAGLGNVPRGASAIEYSVPEVFNAGSYIWELPEGATGNSISKRIEVDFDAEFSGGNISVKAAREGFGSGPATSMMVEADLTTVELNKGDAGSLKIDFTETGDYLTIGIYCTDEDMLTVRIVDIGGRILLSEKIRDMVEYTEIKIDKKDISKGIIFLSISTKTRQIAEKFVIR